MIPGNNQKHKIQRELFNKFNELILDDENQFKDMRLDDQKDDDQLKKFQEIEKTIIIIIKDFIKIFGKLLKK